MNKQSSTDDRGPEAEKIKLERRLDANATLTRRTLANRKHLASEARKSRQTGHP